MKSAEHSKNAHEDDAGDRAIQAKGGEIRNPADQVEYLADLILELKGIAEHARLGTLAGILALALAEARRQCELRTK